MEQVQGYDVKPANGCVAELSLHGRMSADQVKLMAELIREFKVAKTTLTRDGHVRLWNMTRETLDGVMAACQARGITVSSAYEKVPCKVYASALSGLLPEDHYDMTPYADRTRAYLSSLDELPRLRVYFAGSEADLSEASDCKLVFVSDAEDMMKVMVRDDAGELFLLAKTGKGRFLSYVKAYLKADREAVCRDTFGAAFWPAMGSLTDADREDILLYDGVSAKSGQGNFTCGPKIIKQKQEELYSVVCHYPGGVIPIAFWKKLYNAIEPYEDAQVRLDRGMNLYVCNLLAEEVHNPQEAFRDSGHTLAEKSAVSDRCGVCKNGCYDPQTFLSVLLKEMKPFAFRDGVLPCFTFSGCERCCHGVPKQTLTFALQRQTPEGMPRDMRFFEVRYYGMKPEKAYKTLGFMPQGRIVEYLTAIGALVTDANGTFETWVGESADIFERLTALYCRPESGEEE